jgi:transaldolase
MLLVDSADTHALGSTLTLAGIDGFTTNPTLITRSAGADHLSVTAYEQQLKRVLDALSALNLPSNRRREVMLQPVGDGSDILRVAQDSASRLDGHAWRLWIKLLPEWTSVQLIEPLKNLGIATLVTAVYTPLQAELAYAAGADSVAVYVGRLQQAEPNWQKRLEAIANVSQRARQRLLLASFRDLPMIESALAYSADLTIPAHLVPRLLESPLSTAAIADFAARIQ